MRTHFIIHIFLLLILIGIFTSCNSEQTIKIAGKQAQGSTENLITFKVNGKEIKTHGWNISRFMGNGINLNVTSDMHEDKRTLMFNLNGWSAGKYSLQNNLSGGPNSGYGHFKPDYSDLLNAYSFEDGFFQIENIDTLKGLINASFYGTVKQNEEILSITEGRIINGKLTPGIQLY